jgi:uncharacterized membrane protein YeiH
MSATTRRGVGSVVAQGGLGRSDCPAIAEQSGRRRARIGVVTAVGGGVLRDVLLNRVPIILQRDIYASAALVGAAIEVAGERLGWASSWRSWVALSACFLLRSLSLRYGWNLPRASKVDVTDR